MINKIVKFSINNRIFVLIAMRGLIGAGNLFGAATAD